MSLVAADILVRLINSGSARVFIFARQCCYFLLDTVGAKLVLKKANLDNFFF